MLKLYIIVFFISLDSFSNECIYFYRAKHKNSNIVAIVNASKVKISKDEKEFGIIIVDPLEVRQRFPTMVNVIGFSRDDQGKIQAIKSNNSDFESIRTLPSTPFGDGWNRRRSSIIPLKIEKNITDLELKVNSHFSDLPTDLQQIFNEGNILKTASPSHEDKKWSILMMTAPSDNGIGGRSGILLYNGNPIIFKDSLGKELLVELKGAGSAEITGGFSKHDDYTYKGGGCRKTGS